MQSSPLLPPHAAPRAVLRSARWPWAATLECFLTLAVCCLLIYCAQPLAANSADPAVIHRYVSQETLAPSAWPTTSWPWLQQLFDTYQWGHIPSPKRALGLQSWGGFYLALMGGVGLCALWLVRQGGYSSPLLAATLWVGVGYIGRPYGLSGVWWAALGAGLLCGAVLTARWWPWRAAPQRATPARISPLTACVWPGWILFTGIGALLVLDFAAHGPLVVGGMDLVPPKPGARYFGMSQIDGLWLASAVLLACAAWQPQLVRLGVAWVQGVATLWARPRGPVFLLLFALLAALVAGWVGFHSQSNYLGLPGLRGLGKPHISGELLRLFSCTVLAWVAYRCGEWPTGAGRIWAQVRGVLLVGLFCSVGLWLSDDKGPLLILLLAGFLGLGVPLLRRLHAQTGSVLGVLLSLALVVAALAAWHALLVDWLPQWSSMAAVRDLLRTDPFHAASPNMAQSHWLLDAAGRSGFSWGNVPYCGARAATGFAPCTLGSGAPLQMPSDFAYVPLAATLGVWPATMVLGLLLMWLAALPLGLLQTWNKDREISPVTAHHAPHRLGLLPIWLVAVPGMAAQAQVIVSVGAILGWSLLSGVTLPFIAYGTASLCATALWVGLSARPMRPI